MNFSSVSGSSWLCGLGFNMTDSEGWMKILIVHNCDIPNSFEKRKRIFTILIES